MGSFGTCSCGWKVSECEVYCFAFLNVPFQFVSYEASSSFPLWLEATLFSSCGHKTWVEFLQRLDNARSSSLMAFYDAFNGARKASPSGSDVALRVQWLAQHFGGDTTLRKSYD